MRPDDEQTAADLAARFVTAWNARELPFILASFAPEPHLASKEWAGSPEGREHVRAWATARLADEQRARLSRTPGSISFFASGVARVQMPVEGGGEGILTLVRGDRRWVISRFQEPISGLPNAFRVGGVIKEPKKVKHVNPVYPEDALQARESGIVILECVISPQGRVVDLKILRGVPLLNLAAMEAVKQWEYTPTLLEGVAVPVIMTVTVNFRLQ
jgi:protein TonB